MSWERKKDIIGRRRSKSPSTSSLHQVQESCAQDSSVTEIHLPPNLIDDDIPPPLPCDETSIIENAENDDNDSMPPLESISTSSGNVTPETVTDLESTENDDIADQAQTQLLLNSRQPLSSKTITVIVGDQSKFVYEVRDEQGTITDSKQLTSVIRSDQGQEYIEDHKSSNDDDNCKADDLSRQKTFKPGADDSQDNKISGVPLVHKIFKPEIAEALDTVINDLVQIAEPKLEVKQEVIKTNPTFMVPIVEQETLLDDSQEFESLEMSEKQQEHYFNLYGSTDLTEVVRIAKERRNQANQHQYCDPPLLSSDNRGHLIIIGVKFCDNRGNVQNYRGRI